MGARAKLAHELALFNREIKSLKEAVYTSVCPLNAEYIVSHEPTPFDAAKNATYRPIEKGGKWGGFFDCGWFRFSAEIPYTASGKHLAAVIDVDGEGCVYDDGGAPVQGLTSLTGLDFPRPKGGVGSIAGLENHMQPIRAKKIVEISPYAEGGARVNLTVETSNNGWYGRNKGFARLKRAELVIVNDEIKDFYYDWATAFLFYLATDNPTRKKEIYTVLKAAAQAFLTGGESGLSEGKKLLKEGSDNNGMRRFTFFATGHAHLDLAWLWPIRETKRKAVRTYTAALKNIEKYPDYIFGSSQPQQYEWVKDAHPSVYANIKNAVESGRIEPQGGMWVEPDTNVPCGESLIRQVFYGKRFFADEFGKDVKVLWLPDVFGFSAQIPQIVKKTGMEYFLTIKLGWNEHNPFPLNSFLWEGLDGSRILAHIPPEGTYNSDAGPIAIDAAFKNNRDKDRTHVAHLPFGTGDGGGGPGEGELEVLKRIAGKGGKENLPGVVQGTSEEFFKELEKSRSVLKVYKGELYLEKHQGTLTTQARNKAYNRKAEVLFHNVEFLAAAAAKYGYELNQDKLDVLWKEVLLYQFHDILPGSSINRVYEESRAEYGRIIAELNAMKDAILGYLSAHTTRYGEDGGLYAVNPTSFIRTEYLKHNGSWYKADVMPYASAKLTPAGAAAEKTFRITRDGMENAKISVEFSSVGYITSIKSKATGREYVQGLTNRLVAYTDRKKSFNAWDIDIKYPDRAKYYYDATGSKTYQDGASLVRETSYKCGRSTLRQKVILKFDADYLIFETEVVDWNLKHKMLRADIYPAAFDKKATYDIQFGNITRSTGTATLKDYAQFEVCAHKWADVSNEKMGFGLSVLNDCKYGYRIKNGLISLNLLRRTTSPDKLADKGTHTFTYVLYPHEGGVFDGNTIPLGYEINNPLIVTEKELEITTAALTGKKNILTETIKPAYRGGGTILRFYETEGRSTVTSLKIGLPYKEVYEADMLERPIGGIDLDHVKFSPYEIKTILVK